MKHRAFWAALGFWADQLFGEDWVHSKKTAGAAEFVVPEADCSCDPCPEFSVAPVEEPSVILVFLFTAVVLALGIAIGRCCRCNGGRGRGRRTRLSGAVAAGFESGHSHRRR